jgi:hypothetical protein
MMRILKNVAVLALVLALTPDGRAANFSFTGSFSNDTDLQFFSFTLVNPTPGVTLRTWSYAGGTNAAGQLIPSGGFEPYLNLYLSDGTQMNPGPAGSCGGPGGLLPDPITGACDVYYPTTMSFPGGIWAAGDYIAVLSSFANPGIGNLSDGFFAEQVLGFTPPANFTCLEGSPGYQGSPPTVPTDQAFCDQNVPGVQRTGFWALDILNVDNATGPVAVVFEPNTLALGVLAGLLLVAGRRRPRS